MKSITGMPRPVELVTRRLPGHTANVTPVSLQRHVLLTHVIAKVVRSVRPIHHEVVAPFNETLLLDLGLDRDRRRCIHLVLHQQDMVVVTLTECLQNPH